MNLACACNAGGVCVDSSGAVVVGPNAGSCCFNTARCAVGSCATVTDTCTGLPIPCACGAGSFCADAGVCEQDRNCASYGATGVDGGPCSNGASPAFPRNGTTNLSCPCNPGGACLVNGSMTPVAPGNAGVCCYNSNACLPGECNAVKRNTCTGLNETCACGAGQFCNTTNNRCENNRMCSDYTGGQIGQPCSNGPSPTFPRGDGQNLTCQCQQGQCYTPSGVLPAGSPLVGTCCLNTQTCGNACNTTRTNSCSGQVEMCTCAGNSFCGPTNTCVPNNTCATFMASGQNGQICSNAPNATAFPRFPGDTTGLTCSCTGGRVCSSGGMTVTGNTTGTCCTNTASCGTSCNTSVVNTCTGATITCSCSGSNFCNTTSNQCQPYQSCSALGASGAAGARCSRNPTTAFARFPGDTTGQTCGCNAGLQCSLGGALVTGNTEGTCCQNTTVRQPNTCQPLTDSCSGAPIPPSCSAGFHCETNTCVPDRTCASYSASGGIGQTCSTVASSAFPGGPGGANLSCPCDTSQGRANNTCVGSSATVAGTCTCAPAATTNCSQNGTSNGCGGTHTFTCPGATPTCFNGQCCAVHACGTGGAGDRCGAITQCGQTVSCSCASPNTCGGGGMAGFCGCTRKTLADCGVTLPPGLQPDGCGGTILCPS